MYKLKKTEFAFSFISDSQAAALIMLSIQNLLSYVTGWMKAEWKQ